MFMTAVVVKMIFVDSAYSEKKSFYIRIELRDLTSFFL